MTIEIIKENIAIGESGNNLGEFKNGLFHSQGTYTFLNGIKAVGEFRNEKEWNTLRLEKNGNIIGKYMNEKYKTIKL